MGLYVTKDLVPYGVRNVSDIQGTIALYYDSYMVSVADVGGVSDKSARLNIRQVALSMAEAWNKKLRPASWVGSANQWAKWRRLALACLD